MKRGLVAAARRKPIHGGSAPASLLATAAATSPLFTSCWLAQLSWADELGLSSTKFIIVVVFGRLHLGLNGPVLACLQLLKKRE